MKILIALSLILGLFSCKSIENGFNNIKLYTMNQSGCQKYEFTPQFIYLFDSHPMIENPKIPLEKEYILFPFAHDINKVTNKKNYYKEKIKIYLNTGLFDKNTPNNIIELTNENISKLKLPKSDEGDIQNISKININKSYNSNPSVVFISNTLVGLFENSCEVNIFSVFYNASYTLKKVNRDVQFNYIELKPDLDKIDIKNYFYLFDKYNENFAEDIKEIEFSSLNSMKLFLIYLDYSLNKQGSYRNLAFILSYYKEN